jgi:hypothetical protein
MLALVLKGFPQEWSPLVRLRIFCPGLEKEKVSKKQKATDG